MPPIILDGDSTPLVAVGRSHELGRRRNGSALVVKVLLLEDALVRTFKLELLVLLPHCARFVVGGVIPGVESGYLEGLSWSDEKAVGQVVVNLEVPCGVKAHDDGVADTLDRVRPVPVQHGVEESRAEFFHHVGHANLVRRNTFKEESHDLESWYGIHNEEETVSIFHRAVVKMRNGF